MAKSIVVHRECDRCGSVILNQTLPFGSLIPTFNIETLSVIKTVNGTVSSFVFEDLCDVCTVLVGDAVALISKSNTKTVSEVYVTPPTSGVATTGASSVAPYVAGVSATSTKSNEDNLF